MKIIVVSPINLYKDLKDNRCRKFGVLHTVSTWYLLVVISVIILIIIIIIVIFQLSARLVKKSTFLLEFTQLLILLF